MLFLLLQLDADCYALDTAAVREVLPLLELRAIPRAPAGVAGLIDYHGRALPVIDLSELALGRCAARRMSTRIVLVDHTLADGTTCLLGLIAERATRTLSCDVEQFRSSALNVAAAPYLAGLAALPGGLVQRLDVGQLLTPELCAACFARASS
jgi:chemotaxis-related protein WspB